MADTIVRMALDTHRPPLSPEQVLPSLGQFAPIFVSVVGASAEWKDAAAGLEPDELDSEEGAARAK